MRGRRTRRGVGVRGAPATPRRARGGPGVQGRGVAGPGAVAPGPRGAGEAGGAARKGSPGGRSARLIVASSALKMERPCLELVRCPPGAPRAARCRALGARFAPRCAGALGVVGAGSGVRASLCLGRQRRGRGGFSPLV